MKDNRDNARDLYYSSKGQTVQHKPIQPILDRLPRINPQPGNQGQVKLNGSADRPLDKIDRLNYFFYGTPKGYLQQSKSLRELKSQKVVSSFLSGGKVNENQKTRVLDLVRKHELIIDIINVKPRKARRRRVQQPEKTRVPVYEMEGDFSQLIKVNPVLSYTRSSQMSVGKSPNQSRMSRVSRISQFEQPESTVQANDSSGHESGEEEGPQEEVEDSNLKLELKHALDGVKERVLRPRDEQYFGFLKHSERIKDLYEHFEMDEEFQPSIFYSRNSDLFPRKFDMQRLQINGKRLDLSNMQLGDHYVRLIASFLQQKSSQVIKQLILVNNSLTGEGLKQILKSAPENLSDLNLQGNLIQRQGAFYLGNYFHERPSHIKVFNLEDNRLGDDAVVQLLPVLACCRRLKYINLAKNHLSDQIAEPLALFIKQARSLEVLILHWNRLGSTTGVAIAKSLLIQSYLKVLDLSYNVIGSASNELCTQTWCKLLSSPQTELVHLDLSYNSLKLDELTKLSAALESNQRLIGLHVDGNSPFASMDAAGFLQIDQIPKQQGSSQTHQRIDGVSFIPLKPQGELPNCWICGGWMEVKYQYTPGISGTYTTPPIFLHLDFLNYQPILMNTNAELIALQQQQEKKHKVVLFDELTTGEIIFQLKDIDNGEKKITLASINDAYREPRHVQEIREEQPQNQEFYFATFRMSPPNKRIQYFFSNPLIQAQFLANDSPTMAANSALLAGRDPMFQQLRFLDGTEIPFVPMGHVNFIVTRQEFVVDDKNDYQPLIKVYPRVTEKRYALAQMAQAKVKKKKRLMNWCVEQSVFAGSQADNEEHLDACFEFDWGCSKIQRFVKNDYDRQKLKEYIRGHYQQLKDIYRYYSTFGYQPPLVEVSCIPFNYFMKFVNLIGVIDGELLKATDLEIDLISIKNNIEVKMLYNPDKALIRYQFIEMLFRIANDKYIRTNMVKGYADAYLKVYEQCVQPAYKYFDLTQSWRNERLWNKECDLAFKLKLPFLSRLFEYVTEITTRKWYFKLKWIALKEFREFLIKLELLQELGEKETQVIYCLSMSTQVDEINQDRHIRMSFNEFLESLARVAERISPVPMGEAYEKWDIVARQTLALHVKLETLLTYIYFKIRLTDREAYQDLFNLEDPRLSMPRSQIKYRSNAPTEEIDQNTLRTLEMIPHNEGTARTISNIGVLTYISLLRKPYIPPNFQRYFSSMPPPVKVVAKLRAKRPTVKFEERKRR